MTVYVRRKADGPTQYQWKNFGFTDPLEAAKDHALQIAKLEGRTQLTSWSIEFCSSEDETPQLVEVMTSMRAELLSAGSTNLKPSEKEVQNLALDVSLEKARALHRVWRALNDGDCPKCHQFHAATEIIRTSLCIRCPSCRWEVKRSEIADIEKMFAPAMDAAVAIFEGWSRDRNTTSQS